MGRRFLLILGILLLAPPAPVPSRAQDDGAAVGARGPQHPPRPSFPPVAVRAAVHGRPRRPAIKRKPTSGRPVPRRRPACSQSPQGR